MNCMTDESLDQVYFELPIMRGVQQDTCRKLGLSRSALRRRLRRLREEELAIFIGTGWIKSSDCEVSSLVL